MSKSNEKTKISAFDLDLRVRDRNVASGALDPKLLAKHVADLVDLEASVETIGVPQPALGYQDED